MKMKLGIFNFYFIIALLFFFENQCDQNSEDTLPVSDLGVQKTVNKDGIGFFHITKPIHNTWALLSPLADLLANEQVKSVILVLDGSRNAEEIALSCLEDVKALKIAYGKPIIAYSESYLLGADYILACGADKIFVAPLARVGAIGYSWNRLYCHEKNQKDGTVLNFIYSGKCKDGDRPQIAPREENLALCKSFVDNFFNKLVDKLSLARPKILINKDKWVQGNQLNSEEAVEYGLIDGILDKADLIAYALNFAECSKSNLSKVDFLVKNEVPNSSFVHRVDNKKMTTGILEINELKVLSWGYSQILLKFFQDKTIDKIILHINSTGGWMSTSSGLYHDIIKLKQIYNKPVIAYIEHALSSAYHIASAADYIIASPGAIIGGIGAFIEKWDHTQKNDNEKLKYIVNSSGRFYHMLSPNVGLEDDGKMILQNLVDFDRAKCIQDIKNSREVLRNKDGDTWAEGESYIADEALKLGLIDAIGSHVEALNFGNKVNTNKMHELNFILQSIPHKN